MTHLDEKDFERLLTGHPGEGAWERAEEHLGACADCATRLAAARARRRDTQPTEEVERSSRLGALARGATIGRYIILGPVGQGGMGIVYAAHDPELDRKVAIKVLRGADAGSAAPLQQARLLREAQAMARVSHPNVVAVYDVGLHAGQVFLAMELVQGESLQQWLEQERSWRRVRDVLVAAGRGLGAAHAAGLVHRDFKPENVLLGRDGRVLVTDFGLARLEAGSEAAGSSADTGAEHEGLPPSRLLGTLTQAGVAAGTPSYMSPEQHLGRPPDSRSDQFSFCATLYAALYRTLAFDPRQLGEALTRAEAGEVAEARRLAPIGPPPPQPRVPGWLKSSLLRGLSLTPAERFPTMEALLERISGPPKPLRYALRAGLALLALGLPGLGTWAELRRQSLVCSGAERKLAGVWDEDVRRRISSAFARTGSSYAASTWESVRTAVDDYGQRWTGMYTEACQATRVIGAQSEQVLSLRMGCLEHHRQGLEALTTLWLQADGKTVEKAADAVGALPSLSTCANVEVLATRLPLPQSPAAQQEIQRLGGVLADVRAKRLSGKSMQVTAQAEAAVAEARALSYAPLLAEALFEQGKVLVEQGQVKQATEELTEAFQVADAGRDDELRAIAAGNLVYLVGWRALHVEEGLRWARQAQVVLDRMGGGSEDARFSMLINTSTVLLGAGRHAEAREALDRAQSVVERARSPDNVGWVSIYNNRARVYEKLGDLPRAREALRSGVALIERVQGAEHPRLGVLLNNLALMESALGDDESAIAHSRRALAISGSALGPEAPELASGHHTLGVLLKKQHRQAEALEEFQRSASITEKAGGPNAASLVYPLSALGELSLDMGHPAQAVTLLERALALNHPDPELQCEVRFALAQALVAKGQGGARAHHLAAEARERYLGLGRKDDAARVEAWLKAR